MKSKQQTRTATVTFAGIDRQGWLYAFVFAIFVIFNFVNVSCCCAQDDYFPLPNRNPGRFGFPYPPPAPNEPGVSFNSRHMLDGHPGLQFRPRPQDEIWLVSTREITAFNQTPSLDQFDCKHAMGTAWNRVPLEQLLDVQQTNPGMATVVFIHGNRTGAFWSRRRGKLAYQALVGNNPASLPPVRFVIWSWPSDALCKPLKDFQAKMDRSILDGQLFGQFLSMLDQRHPVSLVTYSMGAQIGFTGVETAENVFGTCPPIAMIAMAPVTHCKWSLSQRRLQQVNTRIHQLRICDNRRDMALRAYKTVCSLLCKKRFLPTTEIIACTHPNFRQYDFSESVGRDHNVVSYVSQPEVRAELESILFR